MATKPPTSGPLPIQNAPGQRTALGRLIVAYDPLVVAEVRRLLGPRHFAAHGEDVLQNIRLALVKGIPGLRAKNQAALAAWIRTLVQRQVLDWAKARGAARRVPSRKLVRLDGPGSPQLAADTPTPSRIVLLREQKELIRRAIETTRARYRDVLRFICERSPTEEALEKFTGKSGDRHRKFVERALQHLERAVTRMLKGGHGKA